MYLSHDYRHASTSLALSKRDLDDECVMYWPPLTEWDMEYMRAVNEAAETVNIAKSVGIPVGTRDDLVTGHDLTTVAGLKSYEKALRAEIHKRPTLPQPAPVLIAPEPKAKPALACFDVVAPI